MTTPTPHVDSLVAAYALDAVDADERRLVEEHLRGCAACREELAVFVEAAVHLTDGREIPPPASLRDRVLDAVADQAVDRVDDVGGMAAEDERAEVMPASTQGRKRLTALWGLAAAGVIAVGGVAILQDGDDDLSPVQQVVQADDAQRFEVDFEGEVLAVVSSESVNRSVLLTDDLPALSPGEVYQAWWVDDAGVITSAGVVDGEDDPDQVEMRLRSTPTEPVAVALSVEPAGGSEQPTTEPLLSITLAD